MKVKKYLYVFSAAILLSIVSCVQFKTATLYDGEEIVPPPAKPKEISLIVEPIIYNDATTDVWGLEKNECQEASVSTDVVYSGSQALKVSWDRNAEGCKFSGIGIGWDGYAGKDLSEIIDFVAIQMYVRTQKGRAFGLPMVLTLEDYSGGMGFSYTANKYFERSAIDEEWQKVVVPLNTFEMEKENLDPTNIKQLQIELQQSGNVYLDEIKLVFWEPQPQEPWMEEEVLPSPIATPVQIFDDAFINNNGWGLITDDCQDIKLSEQTTSEGKKSLHVSWDNSSNDCRLTAFGASWNKWRPVDITSIQSTAAFQFDLKMESGSASSIPMKIGFEDYDRAKSFVELKSEFVQGGQYTTNWNTVTVPLSEIRSGLDFTRIKQLYIELEGKGSVYLDNLKLITL